MPKYYKFKNVKHSVRMKLIEKNGETWNLENADYKGLFYYAHPKDLEEVE